MFVEVTENDGEYIIVMKVQEEDDEKIRGRIVYKYRAVKPPVSCASADESDK